jgi:hypothetical protein
MGSLKSMVCDPIVPVGNMQSKIITKISLHNYNKKFLETTLLRRALYAFVFAPKFFRYTAIVYYYVCSKPSETE